MAATDVATELAAMKRIANTLDTLDDYAQARVLVWVRYRYDTVREEDPVGGYRPTEPGAAPDFARPNT